MTTSGVTVHDGNSGANYAVSYVNNATSTISAAGLTITANGAAKTYDGTTYSGGNGVTYAGFVTGRERKLPQRRAPRLQRHIARCT